jgi:predicted ester cyclase
MSTANEELIERNVALVRRLFLEGFSGGNLDVVEEVMSPDIRLEDPNLPPGIEGVKAIVKKNNESFKNWQFTMHDVLGVEDKVVVRWSATGIHVNSFMGEEPTNKEVTLSGIGIYQIADNRIVTDWVVPDNINFLEQLGLIGPMEMTDEEFPKS